MSLLITWINGLINKTLPKYLNLFSLTPCFAVHMQNFMYIIHHDSLVYLLGKCKTSIWGIWEREFYALKCINPWCNFICSFRIDCLSIDKQCILRHIPFKKYQGRLLYYHLQSNAFFIFYPFLTPHLYFQKKKTRKN